MHLILNRQDLQRDRTLGELLIDDVHYCWTVEDTVREQWNGSRWVWDSDFKIPGKTAIPSGTYEIKITLSQRFQRPLPLLLNVPDFQGIRIHTGNTEADTEGCILPGAVKGAQGVLQSKVVFDPLFARLDAALSNRPVFIEIRNPDRS